MRDIIFKTDEYVFSYRVAGLLIHNNRILLQRPINDTGYALPGGHVDLGETNEETLIREFKEEINAKMAIISNDSSRWSKYLRNKFDIKKYFDVISISGDLKI